MICAKVNFRLLSLALFLVSTVILLTACEPYVELPIENQQNQDVMLYADTARQGVIPAHTTKTFNVTFLGEKDTIRIKIVNTDWRVLFSHDYNMAELKNDLKNMGGKIVIPSESP